MPRLAVAGLFLVSLAVGPAVVACGGNTVGSETVDAGATEVGGTLVPTSPPTEDVSNVPTEPPAATGSQPPASVAPDGSTGVDVLVPDPTLVDLVPVRWESATADPVGGEQLVVRFTVTGPPCQSLGRVDVVETPADVTITLLAGAAPGQDCSGPQPAIALPAETVVTLADPLGGRPLRDGATG